MRVFDMSGKKGFFSKSSVSDSVARVESVNEIASKVGKEVVDAKFVDDTRMTIVVPAELAYQIKQLALNDRVTVKKFLVSMIADRLQENISQDLYNYLKL